MEDNPWRRAIQELREWAMQVYRGEPFEATEVRRVETPDGPMHLQTKKILTPKKEGCDGETEF